MTLNVSPQVEAKLFDFARQEGIDPSELVEKMLKSYPPSAQEPAVYTAANDPLMARLEARIAQAATDPKEIDGDVLIAAQAIDMGVPTSDLIIATTNPGHLSQFVPCDLWKNISP